MSKVHTVLTNICTERTNTFLAYIESIRPAKVEQPPLSPVATKMREFLAEEPFGCNNEMALQFANILLSEEIVLPDKKASVDISHALPGTILRIMDNGKLGPCLIRTNTNSRGEEWRRVDGKKHRVNNLWQTNLEDVLLACEKTIKIEINKLSEAEAQLLVMALV